MTKTVAQASRDWRAKRTATIQRYEAALREIADINPASLDHTDDGLALIHAFLLARDKAITALNPEKGEG